MSNLIIKISLKHGIRNSLFFHTKNDGLSNLSTTLFEALVFKCIQVGKLSDREIIEVALFSNISELSDFLEGTDAHYLLKGHEETEFGISLFSYFKQMVENNKWKFTS